MSKLGSMMAPWNRVVVLALACVLATSCRDVNDPQAGGGGLVLDVTFGEPVPANTGTAGGPSVSTSALPPLDQVDVLLRGPTDTAVTLNHTAEAFEGTIEGLPEGTYSVAAIGRGAGLVTYYGRNPSVRVTAGATSQAPITFNAFVSEIDAVAAQTTDFAQTLSFSAVAGANAYSVEISRSADFTQSVSVATTGTMAVVSVDDVGTYYARVRALNSDVSGTESSPSNVVSWEVVADAKSGSDAGSAFNLGERSGAAGTYAGFNIFPGTDEDWFSLSLAAGDEVTVAVRTASLSLPSELDPTVRFVGPDGATLASDDNGGEGVESLLMGSVPAAGTYNLVVGSSGQESVGHYQLEVTHRAPVATVSVAPATASVTPGGTVQFTARTFDGAGVELTDRPVTWSSEDPNVATVDAEGLAKGVASGIVAIVAESEGVTGLANLTVSASVLTVTPGLDTLVALGSTVQLTATGGVAAITWSSSDVNVASVDANGLVTAVGNGTATITADDGTLQGTAVIVVQQKPSAILTNQPLGGLAGQPLNPEPSASLVDANQNVILNELIGFTVIAGGGDLAGSQTVLVATDEFGVARTPWTLGIPPDQLLEVSAGGLIDTIAVNAYFGGQGTPAVDGFVGANEWDASWCIIRDIETPEGSTPGRMCIMNDAVDLYVLVRFNRTDDPNSTLTVNFDANSSGTIDVGDVFSFVIQQDGVTTFQQDGHWFDDTADTTCMTCPAADIDRGGTADGFFQGGNDAVETVFELQIPLSSGDQFDIDIAPGDLIDMNGVLRIWDAATGNTDFTLPGFPATGLIRVLIF